MKIQMPLALVKRTFKLILQPSALILSGYSVKRIRFLRYSPFFSTLKLFDFYHLLAKKLNNSTFTYLRLRELNWSAWTEVGKLPDMLFTILAEVLINDSFLNKLFVIAEPFSVVFSLVNHILKNHLLVTLDIESRNLHRILWFLVIDLTLHSFG